MQNIEEYNSNKKREILVIFDDMITDILSYEKINPVVTELFIRGGKVNISLVFITLYYSIILLYRKILE